MPRLETMTRPTLLDALAQADFGWIDLASSVWEDSARDVPQLHRDVLGRLEAELARLDRPPGGFMPGRVVLGAAGSGKTHLLGALRRATWERDGYFILIDLTGVREFPMTAVLGFLRALEHRLPDDTAQHEKLLERLANRFIGPAAGDIVRDIRRSHDSESIRVLQAGLERGLAEQYRTDLLDHADVLRALVQFSVGRFTEADIAYNWLQGADIPQAVSELGLRTASHAPEKIVAGLGWLMSLTGPCVVGIDQLDAIVGAYHTLAQGSADDDDVRRAKAIIAGVGAGLMDLVRYSRRALVTVCCLEESWAHLKANVLATVIQSFDPAPLVLPGVPAGDAARLLIAQRLAPAYVRAGLVPRYPTFPFLPQAFEQVGSVTPRWLLMQCDAHVGQCLNKGEVTELPGFGGGTTPPPPPPPSDILDAEFNREKTAANVAALRFAEDVDEAPMRRLLVALGRLFALQNGGGSDVDIRVDSAFDPRRPALHLRVEHVHRTEGDREEVFAFRFLPQLNAIAFQGRLTAAMTQSGIDRQLKFRHLVLLRASPPPSGRRTTELVKQLQDKGGRLLTPTEDDLRVLWALAAMEARKPEGFARWLAARRPLDRLAIAAEAGADWPRLAAPPPLPPSGGVTAPPPEPEQKPGAGGTPDPTPLPPPTPPPGSTTATPADSIPVGRGVGSGDEVSLPLALLKKHVAIIAGAGSGKTVLLRRIIEEAARRGVPAIVVDSNNDLALLGERWPPGGPVLATADLAAAEDYFDRAEVVVWTPGISRGNPLTLAPLPDFAALRDDETELEGAVELACATLEPHVAAGRGRTDQLRQGLLRSAMRAFAHRSTGGLEAFIDLLAELPDDAAAGISGADKHATAMADSLRAAIARNPLMASGGTPLDPLQLITAQAPGKVRVSVVNLSGLGSLDAQQGFVNRLALSLFTFVRRNPPRPGIALQALLAIDEAHQFAPANKATPSRESLISLTKQARKYGLGLVFATQMPKDLHHGITNNCSTQIFGKASSPAALDTIEELMRDRGRSASDIARLATGTFYVCADTARPEKVTAPLCLSHHAASPPDARRILELATGTPPPQAPTGGEA
ncbi:ATP-binding protein [Xanthobacter sp. AM11]|uniref:ATP-binding protein n=1 Tax=Xanthobacter sp. AM11 TaxID=3380643 RepID=UPI0039BFD3E1